MVLRKDSKNKITEQLSILPEIYFSGRMESLKKKNGDKSTEKREKETTGNRERYLHKGKRMIKG